MPQQWKADIEGLIGNGTTKLNCHVTGTGEYADLMALVDDLQMIGFKGEATIRVVEEE